MTFQVKLDVAGFYFGHTVSVEGPLTVKALMEKVAGAQIIETDNGVRAKLRFSSNHPSRFLDTIDIFYLDAPKSRQRDQPGNYLNLKPGRYAATDFSQDSVQIGAGKAILAWQFYVNSAKFEGDPLASKLAKISAVGGPLNGSPATAERVIQPFGDFELKEDCLVTWRLIVIATEGDHETGASLLV